MDWQEIDRLIKEYKLQEAAQRLDEMLPAIRKAGDAEEITRALVRGAQLRASSAEPGEAVRFLQTQPWPEGRRQHAVLSLFLAEAIKNYYDNYRWTLWKNEAVLSDKPVDVERWTTGQFFEAVSRAYLEAWKERELLGGIPVSGLGDFLKPNTYPKAVRGTLRDTVAYLWVEHLADTGYWSPAQSNAARSLDLVALLREGELPDEQLVDPEVHPLRRTMAILADHERWHLSRGNRDGALEARLERYRQLRRHALPDEIRALRQELEKDLPEFHQVPWWAMGMAELAGLYQSSGDLPKAVEIARAAHKAYPKSPGGERALALARDLRPTTWAPWPPTACTGARSRSTTRTCPRSGSAPIRSTSSSACGARTASSSRRWTSCSPRSPPTPGRPTCPPPPTTGCTRPTSRRRSSARAFTSSWPRGARTSPT
jgi:hypothetical protein